MPYIIAVVMLGLLTACGEPPRGAQTLEGTYRYKDAAGEMVFKVSPEWGLQETADGKTVSKIFEGPLLKINDEDGSMRFFQVEENGDLRLVMRITTAGKMVNLTPKEQFVYKLEK